jgi:diguanylate cyclase (GGDEF)-like protein/PAS domain S-box-containing protein
MFTRPPGGGGVKGWSCTGTSRPARLMIGAVGAAGILVMVESCLARHPWPPAQWWQPPVAVTIGALADLSLINIRFGHNRHSFTWAEAFVLLGVVLVTGPWLVLAAPVGVLVMHLSLRRPLHKGLFNAAGLAVGAWCASEVYLAIEGGGPPRLDAVTVVGFLVASLVFFVWNHGTVAGVIALSQDLSFSQVVLRGLPLSLLVWFGNTGAGGGLVTLYLYDRRSLVMLPVLLGFVYLVYRGYLQATQEADIWRSFQSVSGELASIDLHQLAESAAAAAASLFEAEYVELLLPSSDSHSRLGRRRHGHFELTKVPTDSVAAGFWPRLRIEREIFRAGPDAPAAQRQELDDFGLDSCVAAPLVAYGQCIGMLRLGFQGPVRMSRRETQVLRTFVTQVAVAVWNADLFERTTELSEQSQAIAASLGEGVIAVDIAGLITFANPAALSMLGPSWGDLAGLAVHDVLHGLEGTVHTAEEPCSLLEVLNSRRTVRLHDQRLVRRGSGTIPAEVTASPIYRGERLIGAVIALRDMTERRALEAQLNYQSLHDPVTDVANRSFFVSRLTLAVTAGQAPVGVLFIDLDRFKVINDSLGHRTGDALLRQVAQRVASCLGPHDVLARWGGDEFIALLEDVGGEREAAAVAQGVITAMSRTFPAVGREVVLTASVGVAVGAPGTMEPQALIHGADLAMYQAKKQGRDTFAVFRPEMEGRSLERLELETAMPHALEAGEFRVNYQPIVAIGNGRLQEVEALLRWNSPHGLLGPAEFIGLAEETGFILPLGRFVLEEACRTVRALHESHPDAPPIGLAVNLSGRQFLDGHLGRDVAEILSRTDLAARHLCLEITESVLMSDLPGTLATLTELKDLGVRLAIDDFGTGYSSLSYLKRFPVDVVKIDKSFVDGLGAASPESSVDTEIVAAVIRMSASLGITTVAEGVETAAQVDQLALLGCPLAQGYYYSPAVPAERIEALVDSAWIRKPAL